MTNVTGGLLHAEEEKLMPYRASRSARTSYERFVIRDVKAKFTSVLTNLANVNARKASLNPQILRSKQQWLVMKKTLSNDDLLNAEKTIFQHKEISLLSTITSLVQN